MVDVHSNRSKRCCCIYIQTIRSKSRWCVSTVIYNVGQKVITKTEEALLGPYWWLPNPTPTPTKRSLAWASPTVLQGPSSPRTSAKQEQTTLSAIVLNCWFSSSGSMLVVKSNLTRRRSLEAKDGHPILRIQNKEGLFVPVNVNIQDKSRASYGAIIRMWRVLDLNISKTIIM